VATVPRAPNAPRPPRPPSAAGRPAPPEPPEAPAPPDPASPIVIDLNAIIAEATKNDPDAQEAAAMAKRLLDRLQIDISPALTAGIQSTAEGLRRGAEELARIAEERQKAQAEHRRIVTERKGGHLGFRVMRGGEEVGQVNARLNLNRVMGTVLSLGRREQGEIPFAIDTEKKLYTPQSDDRPTLEALDLTGAGPRVAEAGSSSRATIRRA